MADNVTLPGTGEVVATDEVAGRQFQLIKPAFGADGVATLVDGANGLPVAVVGTVPVSDGGGSLTVDGTVAVTGALTDAQLRAAAVPVSLASQPLPTGAATEATLAALNGKVPAAGQATMAASQPVAIASDQTVIPVSAAALPLPSGAATETTLAALNAKIPPAGQATRAQSQPVAIASDQTVIPVSEPATLLTGAAAQTATVNNILESVAGATGTNVENLRAGSVQVISTGTAGTFIFEQSNDSVNWRPLPVFNAELTTGVPIAAAITASASQIVYSFPIRCRFLRLRIATTITGGSIQAFSRFSTEPWTPAVATVAQPTAASLNATVSGTVTANIGTGSIAAGTNAIGDFGMQYRANATGAASFVSVMSPATPAVGTVKGTAGRLLGYQLQNSAAGLRSVKVFGVAAPTLGTTAALFEIDIPAGGTVALQFPGGLAFGTACTFSVTSAKGLTDNTATGLAANDVSGFFAFA